MGAHLAAVDGVDLAHRLLDEGVARLALDRLAARGGDDVERVPGQPGIVHDRAAGMFFEERLGQQADDVVALDEPAGLVEEKAAVEVAVPGDADVGPGRPDQVDRVGPFFLDHRVRHTVREIPVRLVMQLDELDRQMRFEPIEYRAGTAVAGVDDDFERLDSLRVDVGEQVGDIVVHDVARLDGPRASRRRELGRLGDPANVPEPGRLADRPRLFAHHLHAVVIRRVVACRHHDSAVEAVVEGGEIDHLGATDADIQHIDSGIRQPADQLSGQGVARQPHVAADGDRLGPDELGVSAADAVSDVLVEILWHAATHIVGFEAVDRRHAASIRQQSLRVGVDFPVCAIGDWIDVGRCCLATVHADDDRAGAADGSAHRRLAHLSR